MEYQVEHLDDQSAQKVRYIFSKQELENIIHTGAKKHARTLSLPGFRPGTVPVNLVKKRFANQILLEETGRMANEAFNNYVKENDYQVLGKPIISDSNYKEGFNEEELYIEFTLGLRPEFELNLDNLPTIPRYTVQISEKDVEDAILRLRYLNYGEAKEIKKIEDNNGTYRFVVEFHGVPPKNEKEDAENEEENKDSNEPVRLATLRLNNVFKPFLPEALKTHSVGDAFDATIASFFANEEDYNNTIRFEDSFKKHLERTPLKAKLVSIESLTPAEDDLEFYSNVFSGKPFSSREEFITDLKFNLEREYEERAKQNFSSQFNDALLEAHDFPMPLNNLREQFIENEVPKIKDKSDQNLTYQFVLYVQNLKLILILEKILNENNDLIVTEAQTRAHLEEMLINIIKPKSGAEVSPELSLTEDNATEALDETDLSFEEIVGDDLDELNDEIENIEDAKEAIETIKSEFSNKTDDEVVEMAKNYVQALYFNKEQQFREPMMRLQEEKIMNYLIDHVMNIEDQVVDGETFSRLSAV